MHRDSSTVQFHKLAGVFLSSIDEYMCLVCVPVGMCECVRMFIWECVCVCACVGVCVYVCVGVYVCITLLHICSLAAAMNILKWGLRIA